MLQPPTPPPAPTFEKPYSNYDKWIWRLPATASIHAILRLSRGKPKDQATGQKLLPVALTLAFNALECDRMAFAARGGVVKELGKGMDEHPWIETALEERLGHRDLQGSEMAMEKKSLTRVERKWDELRRGSARDVKERDLVVPANDEVTAVAISKDDTPAFRIAAPPAPHHSISSLPPRTLEILFLFLAQNPAPTLVELNTAFIISNSMATLGLTRSPEVLRRTFEMVIGKRLDLATETWAHWIECPGLGREGKKEVHEVFWQIRDRLRGKESSGDSFSFGATPRPTRLSAIANLARVLDREWSLKRNDDVVRLLLGMLSKFVVPPGAKEYAVESERWRRARLHGEVYTFVRKVFRGIIEDVIGRPVFLRPASVVVGDRSVHGPPRRRQSKETYKVLIAYALHQFNSIGLATHLVQSLIQDSRAPSASISNTLLPYIARSATEAFDLIESNPDNERTLPTFITYLTSIADFSSLDRLVFAVLPELDLSKLPTKGATYEQKSSKPLPGRSPYLYVTLLNALANSGQTGLAERVFRSARWAAELSREEPSLPPPSSPTPLSTSTPPPSPPEKKRGWILPPHAYTIMLKLYALESLHPSPFSPSSKVIGWGRHALRVFDHTSRVTALEREGGPGAAEELKKIPRNWTLPSVERREAARIVAEYELLGGSKGPELSSLRVALQGEWASKSLGTLFGEEGEGEGEWWVRGAGRERSRGEKRLRERIAGVRRRRVARIKAENLES